VIAASLRARVGSVSLLFFIFLFMFAGKAIVQAQVAVTTWHYNNARTGANSKETVLTPVNVNSVQFGKLFTQPVDGAVVGQALYMPGVSISGAGIHDVVYVATMHDSVYAFDADSATGNNAAPLWHTSFLIKGATPVPVAMQGCGSTTKWTEIGILSTPVIDPIARTLYVVAKTYENSAFVHRLHALDVTTGKERSGSPVVIAASFEYAGKTNTFADAMQVNRPALLLEKGNLYIAFGSNGCRSDREAGWIVAYNAATLQAQGAFDVEPDDSAAAIWMRGGGLSADSTGHIYGSTGDGNFAAGTNFGQSIIKLAQAGSELQLSDWFTPYNELFLDKHDLDMSEPVVVLPYQAGQHHHVLAAVGKEGTVYLLDRDQMGHFCSTCTIADTQIVGELPGIAPETGALVYWNNKIYTSGVGRPITALALKNGVVTQTPLVQTKTTSQGHSPVLSANGSTAGVLWTTGASLIAYDAVTLAKLYSSSQAANKRDVLPELPHFANLVVAGGKVFVGTNNSVVVFGLF
jgi:hypothetical protein